MKGCLQWIIKDPPRINISSLFKGYKIKTKLLMGISIRKIYTWMAIGNCDSLKIWLWMGIGIKSNASIDV